MICPIMPCNIVDQFTYCQLHFSRRPLFYVHNIGLICIRIYQTINFYLIESRLIV